MLKLLCAIYPVLFGAQMFTENCFKFGMDDRTQNFGGSLGGRSLPLGRIVNGTAAQYDMWPFVAMIGFRGYGGIGQFCAGSIINDEYILTAAHCFRGWGVIGPHQFTVTLGAYSKVDTEDKAKANQKTYFINQVTCHENFEARADTIIYDICLIQLNEKVEFNENVMPVCLPESDIAPPPGTQCIVAGWGETQNTGNNSILQKALIPLVDSKSCQEQYIDEGVNVRADQHLCAGYKAGQVDACQGDSGGPLVCTSAHGTYPELFGIVSFGVGCALPGNPGVYTNVARFRNWIKTSVEGQSRVDVPDKYYHCDELNRLFVIYDSVDVGCRQNTPLTADTKCSLSCKSDSANLNVKTLIGLKCFCRSAHNCRWVGDSTDPNFRPNNIETVLMCREPHIKNHCSPPIHQPVHSIAPLEEHYGHKQNVGITCRYDLNLTPKWKKATCKCKRGDCKWIPKKALTSKNVCN